MQLAAAQAAASARPSRNHPATTTGVILLQQLVTTMSTGKSTATCARLDHRDGSQSTTAFLPGLRIPSRLDTCPATYNMPWVSPAIWSRPTQFHPSCTITWAHCMQSPHITTATQDMQCNGATTRLNTRFGCREQHTLFVPAGTGHTCCTDKFGRNLPCVPIFEPTEPPTVTGFTTFTPWQLPLQVPCGCSTTLQIHQR